MKIRVTNLCQIFDFSWKILDDGIRGQKCGERWDTQIECEDLQDQLFHAQHLFLGVSIVGDVNELANIWWIDLFVFGGDEHCRCADQLQFSAHHRHHAQEAIDVRYGQAESLTLQTIFLAYFDQPINQNRAHGMIDIWLLTHVHVLWAVLLFGLIHVFQNVFSIFLQFETFFHLILLDFRIGQFHKLLFIVLNERLIHRHWRQ